MNDIDWPEVHNIVGPCIRPGGRVLTEKALEFCSLPAGSLVADIGCGAGGTLQLLESRGHRPVGLDPSETLLMEAAGRLEATRLIRSRAETIPFENQTFDALFCECVLSILPDRPAVLDEFQRVLKGGGFLVLSDIFSKAGPEDPDGHLCREEILGLLEKHGFTLLLWETHERLLKEFVVRMIFAGECLPGIGRESMSKKAGRSGLSYFLLVAKSGLHT